MLGLSINTEVPAMLGELGKVMFQEVAYFRIGHCLNPLPVILALQLTPRVSPEVIIILKCPDATPPHPAPRSKADFESLYENAKCS